jgi:hypothetical protein
MPAIRAVKLEGFLTGVEKVPSKIIASKDDKGQDVEQHNPTYSQWVAHDQAVLGYLLSSLTRETGHDCDMYSLGRRLERVVQVVLLPGTCTYCEHTDHASYDKEESALHR